MSQIQFPFAGLTIKRNKVDNVKLPVTKARKTYKRVIPSMPFVLQAFDGERWKSVLKDGNVITSKSKASLRNVDFAKCLRDGGFVRQMKIQVYGKQAVEDKVFFKTPVRWRRIDMVSFAR
jgi:hypothetical protein